MTGGVYDFVFRGLLTEEALDRAGRQPVHVAGLSEPELAQMLSLELLDPAAVGQATRMAVVYTAIAAFEASARQLIKTVLLEVTGQEWWTTVSERIRRKAEGRRADEQATKWHAQRGEDLLNYTDLADLGNIIQNNADAFEPYVRSVEWARAVFEVIERSRNVIMHSGVLDEEDIARVGINIRDWIKQVGA